MTCEKQIALGHSIEGRPLQAEVFGEGQVRALFLGAIHGDEPGAAELVHAYAERLLKRPPRVAVCLYANCNPDGLASNRKDNARLVDLNRNFAASNFSATHKPGYFPGNAPLSEPETQAIAQLVERFSPRVVVAVHQPFRCINWDGPAGDLAAIMAACTGYPLQPSIGYPTPGSLGSWLGVDRKVATITFELERPFPTRDLDACLDALDDAVAWAAP